RNIVGMAADDEVLAAGLGMNLDQRSQRHRSVVEAVAAIFAVGILLRIVADLALAVMQRMVGRECFALGLGRLVERVVGGAHVAEAGMAADGRHFLGRKDRAFGLHG